ncbi:MAG: RNA methyltransferase [bacterium]
MAKNLVVLYGKKSIHERLKSNPSTIRKIFVEEGFDDPAILGLARKHKIKLEQAFQWKIKEMKAGRNVQGIVAKVEPFVYTPFKRLLAEYSVQRYSLIFLDGIDDPHNLGVIIRSLSCFGGFGIVLPEQGACKINETAMHVAVGGENHIHASLVPNMHVALSEAKQEGFTITGCIPDTHLPDSKAQLIYETDIQPPAGIVLGAEHRGLDKSILHLFDQKIYIPTPGADLSLNITIACAIVCSEIMRKY